MMPPDQGAEPDHPRYPPRQTLRRRRVTDAARFLPVLGMLLWLVPLIWPTSGEALAKSSSALIYLFVVWVFLIAFAALLSLGLKQNPESDPEPPQ